MKSVALFILFVLAGNIAAAEPISPEDLTELILANKRGMMSAPEMKLKIGDDIIDFELYDLGNSIVRSKTIRKDRVLVVRIAKMSDFFWRQQLYAFVQMHSEYIDKLEIIDIISWDETPLDKVLEKYDNAKAAFNIVTDVKGEVAEKYGIKEGPAVLVFSAEGKLIAARRIYDVYNFGDLMKDLFKPKE